MTRRATAVTPRRAKAMARAVLSHHMSDPPRRLVARGGGLTNFVFEAECGDKAFIVRIGASPEKLNDFIKEQWAMSKAAEVGVPVAEVLQVGNDTIGLPYMISRRVRGECGDGSRRSAAVITEMGRYTAMIHSIRTGGYGHTFDWSANRLSRNKNWKEYLHREFKVEWRLNMLQRLKMLEPGQVRRLRAVIRSMESLRSKPILNHGDMRLKNVLVDKSGRITAILDWENCLSGGTWWDLSVSLHDLGIDEKQAFLRGYGIAQPALRAIAPVIKALNLLNYAGIVEGMNARGEHDRLDEYRSRLSGTLDLYST